MSIQNVDYSYKLAKKISILGSRKGLTINTLAEKSDVSATTIRSILNTRTKSRNPKLSTIVKLAHGLKTPLIELMDFTHQRPSR